MTNNSTPTGNEIIQTLLSNSEATASKVYRSATAFLFLGLLVAAIGVIYFYFSNDALILDRGLLETRISKLEKTNTDLINEKNTLIDAYNKRVDLQSNNSIVINKAKDYGDKVLSNYIDFYNTISQPNQVNNSINVLIKNSKVIDRLNIEQRELQPLITKSNNINKTIGDVMNKHSFIINNQGKTETTAVSYDKPELIFSPKLVYGFFSRLGGLIFIELIAFYLLKQYRINMNDYKYYDNVSRGIRYNFYISNMIENISDEKSKIDIASKIFSSNTNSPENKDNLDTILNSGDMDSIIKLLNSLKELIKK